VNYKGISELTGLSQKAVKRLEIRGVISEPLQEEHIHFMQTLRIIWGDEDLIRQQLSVHSSTRRAKMIFGAEYNRWERWIVTRLLNHFSDREETKFNLHVEQIVDECVNYHNLPDGMRKVVTNSTHKIRRQINNMRYRNITLKEISERLTSPKKLRPKARNTTSKAFELKRQNVIFGH